jgi:FKBP-type peptidyl-prolyl cis-trans isomerase 2
VPVEKAFGKKNSKLIQLIPTSVFTKQKIRPMVGLQVNVDNSFGVIRSVSGGRVIVDFNHPFAGKDLKYDVKINKIFKDAEKKIPLLTKTLFGVDSEAKFDKEKKQASVKIKMPEQADKAALNDKVKKMISDKLNEILDVKIKIETS